VELNRNQLANIFQEAKRRYPELENADINLTFSKGWFFTMQSFVKFSSIFNKKRKYCINVDLRKKNVLSKLSEDNIMGWFGHELAHIVDYETMSLLKFFIFGLRYVFDLKFRFSVEKRINAFAYNNGFAKELFGVWKKFLVMDGAGKKYQAYIIRNYSPYWEDIRETAEQEGITKEVYRSYTEWPAR